MLRSVPLLIILLVCLNSFAQVPADSPGRWTFPQTRVSDGYSIVVHAPQIRSWPDFERFEASVVLEVTHPDGELTDIGSVIVEGDTTVDLERRLVLSNKRTMKEVSFKAELSGQTRAAIVGAISNKTLEIPLDLFLAYLADSVLDTTAPEGFNFDPPEIYVASEPTILLIVGGDQPVTEDIKNSTLQRLVNANWPLFQDAGKPPYYLLFKKTWLSAPNFAGPWQTTQSIPSAFAKLPDEDEFAPIREAMPPSSSEGPAVIFAAKPAELIVINGQADLTEIEGTDGLRYMSNTDSPLFKLNKTWYFLVAGRWSATEHNVERGPWEWQKVLPEAFSRIPEDHPMAEVRASVPGTPEAKMAVLEASLPTRKAVPVNSAAPVEVSYAGEPRFEPIPDTSLTRAVNSGYDVIGYSGVYYLCYAGVWYSGPAPIGPWVASSNVPAAIYAIPPSSPSYNVTQVTVQQSSPTEIVYVYPPAYTTGVYVVYGVPYYGTGWYYPPYFYGGFYYPYYGSYGHGSWYNPHTGGYGSRSVYYGPYGGRTYTSGYNPNTGRYGQRYSAWNGNDWGSNRETYNPRTGVYNETSRQYDGDKNKLGMERTTSRGGESINTKRTTDFDDKMSSTQRSSSRGGASDVDRSWGDGKMTTSGHVETADGRTASIEGSHDRSGGTTTIRGSEGGTATAQTQRSGMNSRTEFETSSGGKGKSVSSGLGNRVTVGKSGSGDLYAARDGQIYKKSGDDWKPYERPSRSGADGRTASSSAGSRDIDGTRDRTGQNRNLGERSGGLSSGDRSRLERDHQARRSAQRSYERRGMSGAGHRSGGFNRGGGGFNRGGGGFSRGGRGGGRGGGRR